MKFNPDDFRAFDSLEAAAAHFGGLSAHAARLRAERDRRNDTEGMSEDEWLSLTPAQLERWAATGRVVA